MPIGTTSNMEWLSGPGGSGSVEYTAGHGIIIDNYDHIISTDQSVVQDKLTAGDNITIVNNVISAADQVQSDWNQTDSSSVDYIKNKPTLPTSDQLLPAATSADEDKVLTVDSNGDPVWANPQTTQQVQSDWAETDSTDVSFIKNKPQNLVQDASYVHTDNNFTTADKNKLDGIESGAEVNVQANWNETNSSSDAYIQNKPQNLVQDASYVHTDNNYTTADKNKLAGIEAGAEVNVQSDWNVTDNTSDAYIKNKPTIITPVQSDWNQQDSSKLDYIKNKPSVLGQAKDLVAGTNITLQQNSNSVIISAQYAGATYNTQQISGSGHIIISSTANISTDLTESGELAAFYRVRYTASADGWQPSATVGAEGGLFTMSVVSTNAYTEFHDYTGGVFTQNHLESLARTGSIDTYSGYLYSVHFSSNGAIKPRNGYSMYFEFLENLPGSTSEYSWVSDGFSQAAAPIDLSYDTIGGKRLRLKMYNVDADQSSVYSYPYISIIVRRL